MREGERRYRLITEHAADLVEMVDRDGRWRYTSPSYGRLLAAEDLVAGADAFRRLHEEDQFRVRAALQELVKSGLSAKLRMRLLTRNGDVRRIESRFRSGMQAESFYDDMYAAVLRTGQWRGSTWCQRRDGTVNGPALVPSVLKCKTFLDSRRGVNCSAL